MEAGKVCSHQEFRQNRLGRFEFRRLSEPPYPFHISTFNPFCSEERGATVYDTPSTLVWSDTFFFRAEGRLELTLCPLTDRRASAPGRVPLPTSKQMGSYAR